MATKEVLITEPNSIQRYAKIILYSIYTGDGVDSSASLFLAVAPCDLDRLRSLMSDSSTDVNAKREEDGATPLIVAAFEGAKECVDVLLEEGKADIHLENNGKEKVNPFQTFQPLYLYKSRFLTRLLSSALFSNILKLNNVYSLIN